MPDSVFYYSASELYFTKSYKGKPMIGGTYRKSRFREYTAMDFRTRAARTSRERHMGLLGPAIRAEVGDTVKVVLLNRTPHPVSIVFQGVSVDMFNSGDHIKDQQCKW